ncbi:MAG: hypothetical protein WC473_01350 [Patescibacteria group bacterium]
MPEKFDFRKSDDQQRFDQLPDTDKDQLIDEAHREALVLDEMRTEILKLLEHEETPESLIEAKDRITDIFRDPDVCIHSTRVSAFYNILKYGLLSRKRMSELRIPLVESWGDMAVSKFRNDDLISLTANRAKPGEAAVELTGLFHQDQLALVYSFSDIEDKLTDIEYFDPDDRRYKTSFGPLRGVWKGEYMAKTQLEPDLLRGISVRDKLADLVLSKIDLALSKDVKLQKDGQLLFRSEDELTQFQNLVLMLNNVLGEDVTIRDILILVGKKLHLPIYVTNGQQFTCRVAYPENDLPPFTITEDLLDEIGRQ